MNILLVNTHYSGGGAEKVTRQLFYGMKSEGINVHLLVGREAVGEDYEVIYNNRLHAFVLKAFTRFVTNVRKSVPFARRKILKAIDKYNIDIVHFNNIHGNYIGIKDIAAISRRCPVVWTLHDMWAMTGHCAHAFDCTLWIDGKCTPCSDLSMFPELHHDNAGSLYSVKKESFTGKGIHFVTPSEWLLNHARNSFLKNESISVINNGVNTDIFVPGGRTALRKKYGIDENKRAILFGAAYLNSPFKGMRYLIDALNALPDKDKYVLVVIGSNMDSSLFDSAFTIAPMGYISDEHKLAEIYSLSDVFIMSSMAENFPCSSIESFACGTPVIAFASGGLAEQIDPSTGILVERGNTAGLTDAITAFFNYDEDTRYAMSESCIAKAVTKYSEKVMLENYIDLYKNILEEK